MKTLPALRDSPAPSRPISSPRALPTDRAVRRPTARQRGRIDRYLRSSDTRLARLLAGIGRERGEAYCRSTVKRALDLAVGLPLAVMALPLIVLLAAANALLEPGRAPFFTQKRLGPRSERLRVVKIRSMPPAPAGSSLEIRRFARFMRRHYLDELPQVIQVLAGDLSLVGIRVLPVEVCDALAAAWSERRFRRWHQVYSTSRLGLTGVHQVFRQTGKEDLSRYHRDLFYSRAASLGFDLYLMWRTLQKAGR